MTFSDVDEMVEQANATEMGLAGYVFGPELGRGLAVAERLQVGMVGLNRGYASDPVGAVRWHEAVGPRTRGRARGHLRLLRDAVRRHRLVADARIGDRPIL